MQKLTHKQQEILSFIRRYSDVNSMAPTVYEIGEEFDIKTSSVFAHLKALERKEAITRSSKARSIIVKKRKMTKTKDSTHISLFLSLPLLGRVNAGCLVDSNEFKEGEVFFDCSKVKENERSNLFALKVQGESMRDLGIYESDIIIVKKDNTAKKGDIVVALYENETTVKSYYPSTNNNIELRPANNDFNSIFVNAEKLNIQGKVIALQREF